MDMDTHQLNFGQNYILKKNSYYYYCKDTVFKLNTDTVTVKIIKFTSSKNFTILRERVLFSRICLGKIILSVQYFRETIIINVIMRLSKA